MNIDDVKDRVRREISKYIDRDFDDKDNFVSDLDLLSDDLTAIAMTLEKFYHVRLERQRYRSVKNADDLAGVMYEALQKQGHGGAE